jgi:hypothetical protein
VWHYDPVGQRPDGGFPGLEIFIDSKKGTPTEARCWWRGYGGTLNSNDIFNGQTNNTIETNKIFPTRSERQTIVTKHPANLKYNYISLRMELVYVCDKFKMNY